MRLHNLWRLIRHDASPAPSPGGVPDLERRRALQALEQEQIAFEQRRRQDASTFNLRRAMGWLTFIAVPAAAVLAWIEPWTLTASAPLNGLAFWNWRRLLRQEGPGLSPTTTPPSLRAPEK